MSVQHLQQQVVQRHFVLALHAVEVLHAFVAGSGNRRGIRTKQLNGMKTTLLILEYVTSCA